MLLPNTKVQSSPGEGGLSMAIHIQLSSYPFIGRLSPTQRVDGGVTNLQGQRWWRVGLFHTGLIQEPWLPATLYVTHHSGHLAYPEFGSFPPSVLETAKVTNETDCSG